MHCITSIVTAFLGQLPTALISPFLYKDFIRAAGKSDPSHSIDWTTIANFKNGKKTQYIACMTKFRLKLLTTGPINNF